MIAKLLASFLVLRRRVRPTRALANPPVTTSWESLASSAWHGWPVLPGSYIAIIGRGGDGTTAGRLVEGLHVVVGAAEALVLQGSTHLPLGIHLSPEDLLARIGGPETI